MGCEVCIGLTFCWSHKYMMDWKRPGKHSIFLTRRFVTVLNSILRRGRRSEKSDWSRTETRRSGLLLHR
uniref:Secreted protein n=1 Tax=Steinernema glaseri TaxID=37863 RepID=A0A1I7ZRB2_9BILA